MKPLDPYDETSLRDLRRRLTVPHWKRPLIRLARWAGLR